MPKTVDETKFSDARDPASMNVEELRSAKATAYGKLEELRKASDGKFESFDESQRNAWEQSNADYDLATEHLEKRTSQSDFEKRWGEIQESEKRSERDGRGRGINTPPGSDGDSLEITPSVRRKMLNAWCRSQYGLPVHDDELQVCRQHGFDPSARQVKFNLLNSRQVQEIQKLYRNESASSFRDSVQRRISDGDFELQREQRALNISQSGNLGGEMIDPGFLYGFEEARQAFGGMRGVAEVIVTETGEPLHIGTINDTGNSGRIVAANAAVATNVDPATDRATLNAHKYTSDCVLVPYELLEDSQYDFASRLPFLLGERIGRAEGAHHATGDGSSKPTGLLDATSGATSPATGGTLAATNAITADELISFQDQLDSAYDSNASWMFNKKLRTAIRLLKDQENQYLWISGIARGVPDTLLGDPTFLNHHYPTALTTDTRIISYGDHSYYKIRDVGGVRMYRLMERYRDNDQDGFVLFRRTDGIYVNPGTDPIIVLKTAAS